MASWLRSQGLGIVCGQATVLLLAVGSVVLTATRESSSRAIQMDDLRGFFQPASATHLWLYLLLGVMTLYAVNTLLATWDSVARKWRAGVRRLPPYGPSFFHVAFLLAMLAHLVGGLWSKDARPISVDHRWQPVADGLELRLQGLELPRLPDGSLKQAWATLEVRSHEGAAPQTHRLGYNHPLSRGLGSELYLLAGFSPIPDRARLRLGPQTCDLRPAESCQAGGLQVELLRFAPPHSGMAPFVSIRLSGLPGHGPSEHWLIQGRPLSLPGGVAVSLEGVEPGHVVFLRPRTTPGNPLALISSIFMVVGVVLLGRRFWPRNVPE